MVTAETAVVLPVLVLLLGVSVWLLGAVAAQLRCVDAARTGARLAARGEAAATVTAQAMSAGPRGAAVSVEHRGDDVIVTVTARVAAPGGGWAVPGVTVRARAVALDEQRVGSSP